MCDILVKVYVWLININQFSDKTTNLSILIAKVELDWCWGYKCD